MPLHVDGERLEAARLATFRQLASSANSAGAWTGQLSSSPLATAAAVSALALAEQHVDDQPRQGAPGHDSWMSGVLIREELTQMLMQSLRWLASHQQADGGWGDADRGESNLAATMMVRAALQLTGVPAKYAGLVERAEAFIDAHGGPAGLRATCPQDPAFCAAVLTNYALADLAPWRQVPTMSVEWSLVPRRWRDNLLGPGPSFAAIVQGALGTARVHQAPPRNPLKRLLRKAAIGPNLSLLDDKQPPSGGFLTSIPATSFIVMSLASAGLGDKAVVRRGVEFLLATARPDGSWPVEADHAVCNTAQAVCALDATAATSAEEAATNFSLADRAVDWLVGRRQNEPIAGVKRTCGGWADSGWDGGPVSATATAAVLRALAVSQRTRARRQQEGIGQAAFAGLEWLLAMEHEDGGWPNYQHGKWTGDRGGADVTAEVVRALDACQRDLRLAATDMGLARRVKSAFSRGVAYLVSLQGEEGSWAAGWRGNQHEADDANRVLGTAAALVACDELDMRDDAAAERGARWLASVQHASGGWGTAPGAAAEDGQCTVEETGAAVEALLPFRGLDPRIEQAVELGLSWLCDHVAGADEAGLVGLSFDRFWYYERLQVTLSAARALAAACREATAPPIAASAAAHA
jgi:squalene-hopene/tetraprenyl-beta-curcumene cyclase